MSAELKNLQAIFYLKRKDWEHPLYYVRVSVASYQEAIDKMWELHDRTKAEYVRVRVEDWEWPYLPPQTFHTEDDEEPLVKQGNC
jgi:hypothetical protein